MPGLSTFLQPIAHRGLHGAPGSGAVENTMAAFDAAIAHGYGIECDLRPGRGGLPLVFHDAMLERLTTGVGAIGDLSEDERAAVGFKQAPGERIPTFSALIERVSGRVPLLVEVKSEWDQPHVMFLSEIARIASSYAGPVAIMSFDPAVIAAMRALAPDVKRGIVSGNYLAAAGDGDDHWWSDRIDRDRAEALSHLLESGPADPQFFAYDVRALPTPVTRYVRAVQRLPIFTWTVRNDADRDIARRFADAPIFEGFLA